jgi:hypothetical protein
MHFGDGASMGQADAQRIFAEYYLRVALWIARSGHVGAQDVASIENGPDRIVYCCGA